VKFSQRHQGLEVIESFKDSCQDSLMSKFVYLVLIIYDTLNGGL
jgi:hypothetical protein